MSFDQVFKELVWDGIVQILLQRLFAAVPFLGFGPIGVVVGFLVGLVADQLYAAIKESIELQAIVFRNAEHRAAFDKAGVKLKIIAMDHGIDSEEFKVAREAHKKALAAFVKFGA